LAAGSARMAYYIEEFYMYEKPSIELLTEYLSKSPFGTIKTTEMETLLFYVLLFKNDDLEKSEYELAAKYYITETKAARMKVEIARRFDKKSAEEYMRDLAKKIFKEHSIDIEWDSENSKIAIPLYDPRTLRAFKEMLEKHQIPYDRGNSGKLIKLTTANFIAVFAKCYDEINTNITGFVKTHLTKETDRESLFNYGIPPSKIVKDFLTDNIKELIPLIKPLIPVR
jgi:hypothetical protein